MNVEEYKSGDIEIDRDNLADLIIRWNYGNHLTTLTDYIKQHEWYVLKKKLNS